jgi:hypothetical protein
LDGLALEAFGIEPVPEALFNASAFAFAFAAFAAAALAAAAFAARAWIAAALAAAALAAAARAAAARAAAARAACDCCGVGDGVEGLVVLGFGFGATFVGGFGGTINGSGGASAPSTVPGIASSASAQTMTTARAVRPRAEAGVPAAGAPGCAGWEPGAFM